MEMRNMHNMQRLWKRVIVEEPKNILRTAIADA
jgi:hypothetical protein